MKKVFLSLLFLLTACTIFAQNSTAPLEIKHFSMSASQLIEGEAFTVTWDVNGVETVDIILSHLGNQRFPEVLTYANHGTASFNAPEGVTSARVTLIVNTDLYQSLSFSIECRYEWFVETSYNNTCPTAEAQEIPALYQAFENGYMISSELNEYLWIRADVWESFQVMPADMPYASRFEDAAPAGLLRPTGDFEMLWAGSSYIRESLGWAIEAEEDYIMTYQVSLWSTGTKGNRDYIITLPDGRILVEAISAF